LFDKQWEVKTRTGSVGEELPEIGRAETGSMGRADSMADGGRVVAGVDE
jgi:hypothetical protein